MQGAAGQRRVRERVVIAGSDGSHRESASKLPCRRAGDAPSCSISTGTHSGDIVGRRSPCATRVTPGSSRNRPASVFVCQRATRADLRVVRHTALAGQRLGVHRETEGEVTLRRKRCPLRPVLNGGGVDATRGNEEQRARHCAPTMNDRCRRTSSFRRCW